MATNRDALMALVSAHSSLVAALLEKGIISASEYILQIDRIAKSLRTATPEAVELLNILKADTGEVEGEG